MVEALRIQFADRFVRVLSVGLGLVVVGQVMFA